MSKYSIYRQCVTVRGGGGVLSPIGDYINRSLTLYLNRFRTYKIASPPQKNLGGEGGLRHINTCLSVKSFYATHCPSLLTITNRSSHGLWHNWMLWKKLQRQRTEVRPSAILRVRPPTTGLNFPPILLAKNCVSLPRRSFCPAFSQCLCNLLPAGQFSLD